MTSTAEKPGKKHLLAAVVLPLALFGYLFGANLKVVLNDPDLWWHLKTGEYIVTHADIPEEDHFALTTPKHLSEGQVDGLRAQWLGQVLYYLAHRAGGLAGVVVFRNVLILLPLAILFLWLLRRGLGVWTSMALVSFPAFLLNFELSYSFERPQGISFVLALVVVILLERLKGRSPARKFDYTYVLLPVLMAFWSNVHGGFIVGNFIIGMYLGSEALLWGVRRLRGSGTQGPPPSFYVVGFLAILASGVNPNGYDIFYSYTKGLLGMFLTDISRPVTGHGGGGSWVRTVVLEYKPLTYFYSVLDYKWLVFYWAFTAVLYALMFVKYWVRRSVDLAELLTVTFVAFFANYYARGLMFSLTVMPFFMGKTAAELAGAGLRMPRIALRTAVILVVGLTATFSAYLLEKEPQALRPGIADAWVTPWYPAGVVRFLQKTSPDPPLYNYYTWGGYFMWRLYPQYKVFIDGRALDNRANEAADAILKAFPGWDRILRAYGINVIATPLIFRETGHTIPLAAVLAQSRGWELVFVGYNSAVFVKDAPRNAGIIKKYGMDKRRVFKEIIQIENGFLYSNPYHPVFNVAKADALLALGYVDEARAIYERFPKYAAQQLYMLRGRSGGSMGHHPAPH
jgi:hypothetical protein